MSDIAALGSPVPRGSAIPAAALACGLGVALLGLAWVLGVAVSGRHAPDPAPPAASAAAEVAQAPAAPHWLDVLKPVEIFSLQAPRFRGQSLTYSARRLDRGEAREDTLSYGASAGEAPMLRLAVLRGTVAGARPPGIADALAALAARQDMAATLGTRRGVLTTRFGRFETTTLRLAGRAAACDGFHLSLAAPALAISGIACGTARGGLACLIDRLDLASAGEDHALADLFAAAELRRDPACDGARLAPDAVHAAWLDDKPATPRRKVRRRAGI